MSSCPLVGLDLPPAGAAAGMLAVRIRTGYFVCPMSGDILHTLSVRLPKPAVAWLRREAQRLGISIGELIRRIVDQSREAR